MSKLKGNLFLYIALLSFLGIGLIFVFDGYLGIFDTLRITSSLGYMQATIDSESWGRTFLLDSSFPIGSVSYGESLNFRYEISNQRFVSYTVPLEVTVWRGGTKTLDLVSETSTAAAFDAIVAEWTVDTRQLQSEDAPRQAGYIIEIKRGETQRRVSLTLY